MLWAFVWDPLNHQDEGIPFFLIIWTRNKRHSVTFYDLGPQKSTDLLTEALLWR